MKRIADYEILDRIGPANHGELYLAKAPERLELGDQPVALKVLDARVNPAAFRRVTRELRAFASTRSQHLVDLYEAGQEGPLYFYVMRHYPAGTLASPASALTDAEMIRVVGDAARAAHALHEAGLAHRDIRPGNIFLVEGSGRLGELGLAQLIAPGQTVTGVSDQSSIEYLDPHILQGGQATPATDIWALGLTLHRALTGLGVYPDSAGDVLVLFRTVLTASPTLSPALATGEREVIERCLAARPRRYATAADLADELDSLATGQSELQLPNAGLTPR